MLELCLSVLLDHILSRFLWFSVDCRMSFMRIFFVRETYFPKHRKLIAEAKHFVRIL